MSTSRINIRTLMAAIAVVAIVFSYLRMSPALGTMLLAAFAAFVIFDIVVRLGVRKLRMSEGVMCLLCLLGLIIATAFLGFLLNP
jgi:hypothetical protein